METRIRKSLKPWAMLAVCLIALVHLPPSASSQETYEFERMWPALQQPWYFSIPKDLAVGPNGNVYIADQENNRVVVFTGDGKLVTQWGNAGYEDGQFYGPRGIDIAENGNVYVSTGDPPRVQVFTSDGRFLFKWGEHGTGQGQFDWGLTGLAIGPQGNIYIADTGNGRIQVFTPEGTFIRQWGSEGNAAGQFDSPEGVDVDPNGDIYVADTGNNRIQVFSSNGDFVREWASYGDGPGELALPGGIMVSAGGEVYVADFGNFRVQVFDRDGTFLRQWGEWGFGEGEFTYPRGIEMDQNGSLYVSDRRIQKFTANGTFLSEWSSSGNAPGSFREPTDIAHDGNGNLYVVDTENFRIQKFDENGIFLKQWGRYGQNEGEFEYPVGIAVDDQRGIVYVSTDSRIHLFSTEGVFLEQWGKYYGDEDYPDEDLKTPYALAVDNNGNVYVGDVKNSIVQKFDSNGRLIISWGGQGTGDGQFGNGWYGPSAFAFDASGNVYVVDHDNCRIQVFSPDGEFITKWGQLGDGEGEFAGPNGIAIDSNGYIYVVEDETNRVQVFDSDLNYVTQFGQQGTNPGQMNSPNYVIVNQNGKIYVSDTGNNRIQVFSTGTPPQPGEEETVNKALIIAGGGPFPGNNLWDATQMCANYAYRALTYQGYTKETIYYLSSDTDLDLDGNGLLDDVDADATTSNLHDALTSWAQDAGDLFVYLVDHGGAGTFRMGETELLSAQDLDTWLDELQQTIPGPVTLLYDACRSGSFLPLLLPPPGKERILVTSASSEQEAIFGSQGTISFSFLFWGHLFNGDSFYDSLVHATNSIGVTYPQDPLLEANGNTTPNEREDQEVARSLTLGNETKSAGDIPSIGTVSPSQSLTGETSALLYADGVIDADGISRVWAVITPPDHSQDPNDPVIDLPILELIPVGNDRYEGTYPQFSSSGTYTIAVYASDRGGVISLPKGTTVTQGQTITPTPLYFPHIDTTSPWGTEIALINTSAAQSVSGTLNAYSNTGQLIDTMALTLGPHGRRQLTIADELANHTNIGYLIFDTDAGTVCGYTKFYVSGQYRVAVPAVKEVNTSDIYLSHIDSSDQWWTGVSLLNTTESSKTLTLSFDTGQEKTLTLAAKEHQAFTIAGLFEGQSQPDIGSGVITNAEGVVGLELFGSGNQLSGILLKDDTASTLYYPHVAAGEWWTGIVAYNPSSSDTTLTLTPYRAGGGTLTAQSLSIPGKGKYIGTVAGLSLPTDTAWFTIEATSPLTGFELFGTTNGNQLAGYTGVGINAREGIFAKVETDGWTGIAFVNIEDTTASVTLTAYDNYGTPVATQTLSLGAYAKEVRLAQDFFDQDIGGATYIGYASDKELVGFQLNGSSDGMMLDGLPGR